MNYMLFFIVVIFLLFPWYMYYAFHVVWHMVREVTHAYLDDFVSVILTVDVSSSNILYFEICLSTLYAISKIV